MNILLAHLMLSKRWESPAVTNPYDYHLKGTPCNPQLRSPLQDFQDFLRVRLALANEYRVRGTRRARGGGSELAG